MRVARSLREKEDASGWRSREHKPAQQCRSALAYVATCMLPKNACVPRRQSRCAPAYVGDADASEECTHAAPAESMRSSVRRRRGCFRRMHACRAAESLRASFSFDAAEPRALDAQSAARRRAPSPLIPSPIYGIIYEFSDFWAQFWTIFKSTRPPIKS